jgi:hypothetical protein
VAESILSRWLKTKENLSRRGAEAPKPEELRKEEQGQVRRPIPILVKLGQAEPGQVKLVQARRKNKNNQAEIGQISRRKFAEETDATFTIGHRNAASEIDRFEYDREKSLRDALTAWRVNPLARRMVELTSQYVVGGGIAFSCEHAATAVFLKSFWEHPLNRLPIRLYEWCDELTRSGNLFLLLSTDAAGMTYVRALPTCQVKTIHSRANDLDQETAYEVQTGDNLLETATWPAYDARADTLDANGRLATVMLHYAVNRAVGSQWGESDLAPLLKWVSRYASWLEDRARLNHFRTAFLYVVHGHFNSEAERRARQSVLNSAPPSPGSILVTDEGESWEVLNPELASDEAGADGLALKKMLAAGAGIPLHFLAEPEGATRTTAEAAGGPTYRHYEQRQRLFLWILSDLLKAVVQRRSLFDGRIPRQVEVSLHGSDISSRDNLSLATAVNNVLPTLCELRNRSLIDDAELLRLAYRFCGETVDIEGMLARGASARKTGEIQSTANPAGAVQALRVNPESGEESGGDL